MAYTIGHKHYRFQSFTKSLTLMQVVKELKQSTLLAPRVFHARIKAKDSTYKYAPSTQGPQHSNIYTYI